MLLSTTSEGNVGIGTTSITDKLTVYGGIKAIQSDSVNTSAIALDFDSDIARVRSTVNGTGTQRPLGFFIGGSENMRIDSTGNVGIGTSSPAYPLDVDGLIASRDAYLITANSSGTPSAGAFMFRPASNTLALGTNSTEALRIDSSGNVGIGTDSPSGKLHSVAAVSQVAVMAGGVINDPQYPAFGFDGQIGSNGGRGAGMYLPTDNTLAFSTAGISRMRIDSAGHLLVGTTSATAMGTTNTGVVLRDNDSSYFARNSNGTIIAFFSGLGGAGSISLTGNTANYNTTSDERLKENITDSADAGSKVDAIQIRQFDWKADSSHQDYGVIAQELINVAPEAVSEGDTEEDMMGVDYSKLVPMLIKEVQSLRSRVAELENV